MVNLYNLLSGIDIYYFKGLSVMSFFTIKGVQLINLPKFYYISISKNKYNIVIFNKGVFKALLSHILTVYKFFNVTKFIKLRIRGLGYEVRECSLKIYSFCFNWINYIYLFAPLSILLRVYKKRFFIISNTDIY